MGRKLDVGCGSTVTEGYERLDAWPDYDDLDFVCELDAVPVDDGTFERVRASHVIEHVPIDRVRRTVLPEWLRILEPGGTLWVDTPNIERNVRLYSNGGWEADFARLKPHEQERLMLNGVPNKTMWLTFKVFSTEHALNCHYWGPDPDLLTMLFEEAGFVNVRVVQTEPSVIVEGRKPE